MFIYSGFRFHLSHLSTIHKHIFISTQKGKKRELKESESLWPKVPHILFTFLLQLDWGAYLILYFIHLTHTLTVLPPYITSSFESHFLYTIFFYSERKLFFPLFLLNYIVQYIHGTK